MARFILKRILSLVPTLFIITFAVFMMLHLAPGDPVALMIRQNEQAMGSGQIAQLRHDLGLDRPLLVQYGDYVSKAVRGDLGQSIYTNQDVFQTITQRMPNTITLALAAMIISLLIAIPVGVISATMQHSLVDYVSMAGALVGVSMPSFWFGLMLMLLFAVRLNWLPSAGMAAFSDGPIEFLRHLFLPALTLGFGLAGLVVRLTRSSVLEVIRQDFIRTARAKGLPERVVIYRHALRNALIPVVTVIGIQFGELLGGAVITETIFAWPGVGRLAIDAISRRDFPMVQGNVLIMAFLFIMVNLVVDIAYSFLNPKIRYQ